MRALAFALTLGLLAAGASSVEPPELPALRFDPFALPDLSGPGGHGHVGAAGEAWQPLLRGTLVAGPRSLADLGGVVLGLGEEFQGYRLLAVSPFQAEFEHDGERVLLLVETPAPESGP